MKKKYMILACAFGAGMLNVGCDDFLEEQSQEKQYATTCADLDEVLVGDGYMRYGVYEDDDDVNFNVKDPASGPYFPWLHVMSDESTEFITGNHSGANPVSKLGTFYEWKADPFFDEGKEYADKTWGKLYEHIATANVLLSKVDEFTQDSLPVRDAIKGQCYFIRAASYFMLVNLYAKAYDPATSDNDPGVPVKTDAVVHDIEYSRDPVDSVYNLIVADLRDAITYLEGYEPPSKRRASLDAAKLLLSRVYCYMGNYEPVPDLCNDIINSGAYALTDLTTADTTDLWLDINSPEIIFTQGTNCIAAVLGGHDGANTSEGNSMYRVSDELMAAFEDSKQWGARDRRPAFSFTKVEESDYYMVTKTWCMSVESNQLIVAENREEEEDLLLTYTGDYDYVSDIFTLRYPEVYLNLAEACVMLGREGEAVAALETLMKNRIEGFTSVSQSGEALMQLVRDERWREFCFEGQRWFDLRRYAVNKTYPYAKSVRHNSYDPAYGESLTPGILAGYYELPAYPDNSWVLPIPKAEIEVSDGKMVDNDRSDCLMRYEY